jgi:branched-chain amino acid transport system permease protein
VRFGRPAVVTVLVLLVLGAAPSIATATGHAYFVPVFTRVAIYGLAALSLNFILGYGGLVSFGHAAFFGIGAYVMGILSYHAFFEDPFLGSWVGSNEALVVWPLAMLISALAALVIGIISLRTKGVYFIMITLAFAQMLFFFFVSLQTYGGEDGLSMWWGRNVLAGLELRSRLTFFYVVFTVLVVSLLVFSRLVDSRFGWVLRGCKENELRMRALGYNPLPYQLTAFCIAGAMGGLAGVLLTNLAEFVSPDLLHWSRSGQLMVMVILGGMSSLIGPVLGAAAFLLIEEVLIAYTEHWQLIFGPILILFVLFAKRGLAGVLMGGRARE